MAYNDMVAAELRAEIGRQGLSREAVWDRVLRINSTKVSRSTWFRMVRGDETTPFDVNTLEATAQAIGLGIPDLLAMAANGRSAEYRCTLALESVPVDAQVRGGLHETVQGLSATLHAA